MRQLVPHVQHRLLVHRLVLDDGVDGLRLVQQRMPGLLERRVRQRVEDERITRLGKPAHVVARRPFGLPTPISRRVVLGVDAAREHAFEPLVDARAAEGPLDQRVHAERRQVPLVEDDGVSQRDRARAVGLRPNEIEQLPGALAIREVLSCERMAIQGRRLHLWGIIADLMETAHSWPDSVAGRYSSTSDGGSSAASWPSKPRSASRRCGDTRWWAAAMSASGNLGVRSA